MKAQAQLVLDDDEIKNVVAIIDRVTSGFDSEKEAKDRLRREIKHLTDKAFNLGLSCPLREV